MAKSKWVIDVTDDTFTAEVVERSRTVPVVVDFWAPWCGPCRALAPLLEKVVDEQAGAVVLAKVNSDENPGLAQQFASEGIPAVYGIRDGTIVNRFVGMLPEAEVREFVAGLKPTATDEQVKAAAAAEAGDPAKAEGLYRGVLAADAANEAAKVGLARVLLQKDGSEAEATTLLAAVEVGAFADEAERLRAVVALREVPHGDAELAAAKAGGSSGEALLKLGAVHAARGDYAAALDTLLAAAEEDKALARGAVREAMVKLFRVVGGDTADTYRRRLQALLY